MNFQFDRTSYALILLCYFAKAAENSRQTPYNIHIQEIIKVVQEKPAMVINHLEDLEEINKGIPLDTPLTTNLHLAKMCYNHPNILKNAYFHARNRCYWILISLNAFFPEASLHESYQTTYLETRKLIGQIYSHGGHGIKKDHDLALIFLSNPGKIPNNHDLINSIEKEGPLINKTDGTKKGAISGALSNLS